VWIYRIGVNPGVHTLWAKYVVCTAVRFRLRGSTCRTFSCVLVIRKVRTGPFEPALIILYVSGAFIEVM